MDYIICPKCGASNRSTSRFCARCGEKLPQPEEQAGEQGSPSLELPWLQGVQEKAAKPDTERLAGEQVAAQSPQQPAQEPPAEAAPAAEQPAQPQAQPQEQGPAQAEQEGQPSGQPAPEEQQPSAPDEPPPPWVVSILEPTAPPPAEPQQDYEPEELSHIMPWAHGAPEGGSEQAPPGLPPWLSDITVQETLRTAPAQEQTPQEAELGLEDVEPFVPPEPETAQPQPAEVRDQVPEWLQTLSGQQGVQSPVTGQESAGSPRVPAEAIAPIDHNVPVRAPRPGAIETLAALVQPVTPQTARRPVAGSAGRLAAAAELGTRTRTRQWRLADWVIYLIILAALLAVLIVQPPFGDVTPPAAPDVQQFYNTVEDVAEGEPVLVVYDWDATRSAEMSVLSEAVMNHLMSRRLHFVTVSTAPQGPGFARQIAFSVANDPTANYGYVYGREFLVLGYIPGNEAALTTLVSNFSKAVPLDYVNSRDINSYDIISGGKVRSVDDFALIIVLASEEAELRNWIEQVATRTKVPLIAAVPQGLDPMARPYKDVPGAGLKAVVSGPAGAMQYARQIELGHRTASISLTGANLTSRLNAQSVAQLLMALAIVIALVSMVTRRILRR